MVQDFWIQVLVLVQVPEEYKYLCKYNTNSYGTLEREVLRIWEYFRPRIKQIMHRCTGRIGALLFASSRNRVTSFQSQVATVKREQLLVVGLDKNRNMTSPISDLQTLIRSMEPVLNPGTYVYTSLPHDTANIASIDAITMVREVEGITLVVAEETATKLNLTNILFRCAWITLHVHSDLNAVGLTAAFASALGTANISCNVVAGAYHDHIFVPVEKAGLAMQVLKQLQQTGTP